MTTMKKTPEKAIWLVNGTGWPTLNLLAPKRATLSCEPSNRVPRVVSFPGKIGADCAAEISGCTSFLRYGVRGRKQLSPFYFCLFFHSFTGFINRHNANDLHWGSFELQLCGWRSD